MKSQLMTFCSMHYCGGCERTKDKDAAFWIMRGHLRGPKGKRYFDYNAKDTVELADVHVTPFHAISWQDETGEYHFNHDDRAFNGLYQLLEAQYATESAPPVDWSL